MDEALELRDYLPQSFANAGEGEYLAFLWSAFETNYREARYEFASLAFHLLYMSFVSFSIWQIRLARPDAFRMAMVGFRAEDESSITECGSPFKFYERLKESQIFRFLKLIGCNNIQVGEFAKFVKRRNKIAHPTGTVFFNDKREIDAEIDLMMREVRNIETHMQPIILELYEAFLKASGEAEELEYAALSDEVTANLIHRNYLSLADLRLCSEFDVARLAGARGYDVIRNLDAEVRSILQRQGA